jgi:hypothetical protein
MFLLIEAMYILPGSKPTAGTRFPFKETAQREEVIQPPAAAADKPGLITAFFPEELQGQFRIGKVLIWGIAPYPVRRIRFKPQKLVQGIHVSHNPIRP